MDINNLKFMVSRGGLILSKHSPEILMGAGILGVVGSTIWSCTATLKAQEVIAEVKDKKEKVKEAWKTVDRSKYTDEDHKKDLAGIYGQATGKLVRLYGPPILLGGLSIGCLLGSHHILTKRNAGLAAAYKLLDEGFKKYRSRVVEKYGEGDDRDFRYGTESANEELGQNADEANIKAENVLEKKRIDPTIYAKWFDEDNIFWRHDFEHNIFFLRTRQSLLNLRLQARGHVFLNEVWDELGIPRTSEGAVVGWVWDQDDTGNSGDNYIDFGLNDAFNKGARDFVNGYKKGFLIDPNVQGDIHGLI